MFRHLHAGCRVDGQDIGSTTRLASVLAEVPTVRVVLSWRYLFRLQHSAEELAGSLVLRVT